MLKEEGLALSIGESAANSVQNSNESLEIEHAFLLNIQELEGIAWTHPLVCLNVSSLPYSLIDGHF